MEGEHEPRPHACSPAFISSMYPWPLPSRGELVVCRATRCDEMSATYELLEYTQPPLLGMCMAQELSRRKMRSLAKIVRVGELDVLRVLHVDKVKRYVDLSKKDVSEPLKTATLIYFRQAQAAHEVALHAARLLRTCSYCFYCHFVWPLAAKYQNSLFLFIRQSLIAPVLTLGEYRECSCLHKMHPNALNLPPSDTNQTDTTSSACRSPSLSPSTPHHLLLTTPRVLPEIARRCEHQRVHLDLSRLMLDQLPRQLLSASQDGAADDGKRNGSKERHHSNRTINGRGSGDKEKILSLRSLNVEENPLYTLPSAIGRFHRLQELNVNNCRLSDLPSTLAHTQLQRLYACGNEFACVPPVIHSLHDLTQLNLCENKINKLHAGELVGLTNLLELSLARNSIQLLPPDCFPPSLQSVDLSHNNITELPPELLSSLPNLLSLELKHNQLTSIAAPPTAASSMSPLHHLEFLDLSFNKLTDIAADFFADCASLTYINLAHNRLTLLPSSIFTLIQHESSTPAGDCSVEECKSTPFNASTAESTTTTTLFYLNCSGNPTSVGHSIPPEMWANLQAKVPQLIFDRDATPEQKESSNTRNGEMNHLPLPLSPAAAPFLASQPTAAPSSPVPSRSAAPPPLVRLLPQWSTNDVVSWLSSENLFEFIPAFEENEITGSTLMDLDKSDLRDLGITKLGQQKRILKLIQQQKDKAMQAQQTNSTSATPRSVSLQASPTLQSAGSGMEVSFSSLSLGPARLLDVPPAVPVRRSNSRLASPALNSLAPPLSGPPALTASSSASTAPPSSTTHCDPRQCELYKHALLTAALASEDLAKPALLRCIVALLIGRVYSTDEAKQTLDKAVEAGKEAAAGGAIVTPWKGLYGGLKRSTLHITPLLCPLYCLSLPCLLPSAGIAVIESVIGSMNSSLEREGKGGRVKVCVRPYIVSLQASITTLLNESDQEKEKEEVQIEGQPGNKDDDAGDGDGVPVSSSPSMSAPLSSFAATASPSGPVLGVRNSMTPMSLSSGSSAKGEILAAWQLYAEHKRAEKEEKARRKAEKKAVEEKKKKTKQTKKEKPSTHAQVMNADHSNARGLVDDDMPAN